MKTVRLSEEVLEALIVKTSGSLADNRRQPNPDSPHAILEKFRSLRGEDRRPNYNADADALEAMLAAQDESPHDVTLNLSVGQRAALDLVARKFRMPVAEMARLLAFIPINQDFGDRVNFHDHDDEIMDALDAGNWSPDESEARLLGLSAI